MDVTPKSRELTESTGAGEGKEARGRRQVVPVALFLAVMILITLPLRIWIGGLASITVAFSLAAALYFLLIAWVADRHLAMVGIGGFGVTLGLLFYVLAVALSTEGLWTPILYVLPVIPALSTRLIGDAGPKLVLAISLVGIVVLTLYPGEPGPGVPHPTTARALVLTAAIVVGAFVAHYDERRQEQRQRRLDSVEARYTALFERIAQPVMVTSGSGRILAINDAALEALDFRSRAEAFGTPVGSLYRDPNGRKAILDELNRGGSVKERFSKIRTPAGRDIVIVGTTVVERSKSGEVDTLMTIFRDVTREHQLQKELVEEARRDHLTGLVNRRGFEENMAEALERVERYSEQSAVLLIDLDGFKNINDSFGHSAGDAALRCVSERLADVVRSVDTLARLGGDEFVVIDAQATHEGARSLADRILAAIQKPIPIEGREHQLNACIGIAFAAPDGHADSVVDRADRLLYGAKAQGQGLIAMEE